jgi:hypothetical protein
MPSVTDQKHRLLALFSDKLCWMIEPLAGELHYSIPSVRRFLSEAGYYSSFTHNGAWYTLRSLPRFGTDGLWFCDDIGFSRAGSLTKTLIELTSRSSSGMTAEELGEKLRCRCHAILVQLCRQGRLERQKQGRAYVYLAADPPRAASQRQALAKKSLPAGQLPAEIAVLVLAEFIKNPKASVEQLVQALTETKGVTVAVAQIQRLFVTHDLKKTLPPVALTP